MTLTAFTVPSGAHVIGDTGHTTDHDNLVATLNGLGATLSVLNTAYSGGADPLGRFDSTAAITGVIAVAKTYGAKVLMPAGTYKTTATIDYTGVTIIGDSSWPTPDQDYGTVIVPSSAVTGSVLQNSCANTGGASAVGGQLYGIGIDGSATTGSVIGIYAVGNVLHGVISGCFVYGTSGSAIDVSSANSNASGTPYGWHVDRVKIDTAGGYGVSCGGHTDGQWYDVHVINSTLHGWYINKAPSNSRFIGCRAEWSNSGYYGYYLTGTWNNGTGSGGCVFTACSTDRNDQDGIHIDATGNEPVIFDSLMLRRDGRNGGTGGGSYAGLNLDATTIPVIIGTISVFPGVDDTGAGTNSPEYGVEVTSSSYLEIAAGYIQGATNAVHQVTEAGTVNIGPNVFTASGTTSSPVVNTTPYFATMNGASLFLQKTASSVATLSVTNLQSSPANATTQFYAAAAADKMFAAAVTGDADARFTWDSNGKLQWGSGSAPADTDLYRSAAGILKTDEAFVASPLAGGTYLVAPYVYAPSSQVQLSVATTTLAAWNATATTVASGSNGGEISTVASWAVPSAGVLDVASTTGWPTSGTVNVAASGATTAVVTYTGISSTTLTGCAYVSGSATGTVATGGAVTLTSVIPATGAFTAPPSGDVMVTVACLVLDATAASSGHDIMFGLAAAGTVTPVIGTTQTIQVLVTQVLQGACMKFYVSGLTAGTSYNLALLGAIGSGDTATIYAYGPTSTTVGSKGAPLVMTVQAV